MVFGCINGYKFKHKIEEAIIYKNLNIPKLGLFRFIILIYTNKFLFNKIVRGGSRLWSEKNNQTFYRFRRNNLWR